MKKVTVKRISFLFRQLFAGNFKNVLRYKLWLIGYQDILPKSIIDSIEIVESNEPLVEIISTEKIICVAPVPFARKGVVYKLVKASNSLPRGVKLKILHSFRSNETQKQFWDEALNDVRLQYPNATQAEIEIMAQKLSARPGGIGPHQTGGAVDVTLIDENGNEFAMGTNYRNHEVVDKIPMFSKLCTNEEKFNRSILRKSMLSAGFYFYPGEWWHYSYGDRAWATYTGEKHAIYGEVKN